MFKEYYLMDKLEFDEMGNGKPYTFISLTYTECEEILVNQFPSSITRKSNWKNFLEFHKDIENVSKYNVKHWIDGSFVTKKLNPKDIDVVSFVRPENLTTALQQFDMQRSDPKGYVQSKYNIDNYIIVDLTVSHPYYDKMQEQIKYWSTFFSTDRNNNPKAIVRLENGTN